MSDLPSWSDDFFEVLEAKGDVKLSADLVGIHRNTVYYHVSASPTFADRFDAARKIFEVTKRKRRRRRIRYRIDLD